jgi:hypothetical protein
MIFQVLAQYLSQNPYIYIYIKAELTVPYLLGPEKEDDSDGIPDLERIP